MRRPSSMRQQRGTRPKKKWLRPAAKN